ncbi:MAG: polyhydroxyalkanoic acid system family protein [Myxococcota bacterium]|nr:polyhydroxyalkanoic acid system family protein [Myxococcota bacterium]
MSTITVRHEHSLSREEARKRINDFEEILTRFGASLEWEGDRAEVKGFGVTGNALIDHGWVEVSLKLGMIAKAAGVDAERVEASIKKRLVAAFAESPQSDDDPAV